MRILLLSRALTTGGVERQIVLLALALRQLGQEVAVAVFYTDGPLEAELRQHGVPILNLRKSGRWDTFSFFRRCVRAVRSFEPHVIYGFLSTPNLVTVLLKPIFPRIKMVWGVRASHVDYDAYDWLFRFSYWAERRLAHCADLIICNSQAGLQHAAANGFPRARMISVPNGIDIERFSPDLGARATVRSQWVIDQRSTLIGLVGRLDPMKDHSTFLRAAALLAGLRSDVRFVCVGDGPASYKAELQELAATLGLTSRLIWAGERHDMPAVFNALDIGCSSSSGEGFSNVIAEAMACGVPCVVTDVGDSALIVGATGEVVPARDPEALCRGLVTMLARLDAQARSAARASITTRFTNDVLAATTLRALSEIP